MVPKCMVYQPPLFALAIHDSPMGGELARLPKVVEAPAGRRAGLERLYRFVWDCDAICPPMTMPLNSAIDSDNYSERLRAPIIARHRGR